MAVDRTVSVIVPSYNRPEVLARCLEGLAAQTRPPEQIVLVIRGREAEYREVIGQWSRRAAFRGDVRVVTAERPGQTVAMNLGLAVASGEIVCFTDDDTVPHPDWIERLLPHYDDPRVAGVGGRDIQPQTRNAAPARRVGRVTWCGRLIGGHHLGAERVQDVDHLKGANMSFRRALLPPFEERLLGDVAYNEVDVCLPLRRSGYRLIYDPAVRVDHFLAPRHVGGVRGQTSPAKTFEDCFNSTLVRLKHLPPLRLLVWLAYSLAIGSWSEPGLLTLLLGRTRGTVSCERFLAGLAGRREALRVWRAGSRTPEVGSRLRKQQVGSGTEPEVPGN